MNILVFVTNITNKTAVRKISPLLTAVPAINGWNFDLDDCDRILRIEANELCPREVEDLLQRAGFTCRELEY